MTHPALNAWRLFGLLFLALSLPLAARAWNADFSQAATVSAFIALSVQVSVPWLYLAFAASSLARLLPGPAGHWLRRNRRYLGLAYAAGMGWQLLFIAWLLAAHIGYYNEVADNPYDLAEEIPGYVLLLGMVATSLGSGRRWLSPRNWQRLHLVGIYYLWAETWSTYWWYSFYYENPQPIYYLYFWAGLLAWAIRVVDWRKTAHRQSASTSEAAVGADNPALISLG